MNFTKLLFKSAIIITYTMGLSSCYHYSTMEPSYNDNNYYNYYNSYYDERAGISYTSNTDDYQQTYDNYNPYFMSSQSVNVPKSYHMNQGQYARSHKSRDQSWANKQLSNNYTILLDSSGKASKVAQTLVNAPKTHRTAQIKYQHNGQAYYKGVYGSYKTKQDANNAYKKLPAHLKNKAGIKQWHQLQRKL